MAARASHISLLLIGIVLLTKYSALVKAETTEVDDKTKKLHLNSEEEDTDNADQPLKTRGFLDGLVSNVQGTITSAGNSFNNFGNSGSIEDQDFSGAVINSGPGGTLNSFNNNGGKQNFKGAVFNAGPGSGDTTGDVTTFSGLTMTGNNNLASNMISMGKTFEMTSNGLTIRVLRKSDKGISISNNQIFVGDKLVCDDINKASGEPTYQKTVDGSLWYTNVKVGKPMTKAEIENFKADWAQHKKEREEQAAERRRRHNERMNALKQRLERQAESRNKRTEARNARLKKQAEDRARRAKRGPVGRSSSF